MKYSSSNKEDKFKNNSKLNNIINISPNPNKYLKNIDKKKHQKKEIMKIIQKRLNHTNLRNPNITDKNKNIELFKKESNIKNNKNSVNTSNIISKNKKQQKNKKVKIIGFSDNNKVKDKINNINNINYSQVNTPPKSKKNKKINSVNKLNGYFISNYKNNIVHRHTKSLYNQETILLTYLIKDMNNSETINFIDNNKKLSVNKNNKINNINNYNTKSNYIKNDNNNNINRVNKLNKITKYKKSFKSDLIKHKREYSDKGSLVKIIDELKLNINNNSDSDNNNGLTKKFIIAQNNWRMNYFATVIQKIYRGYCIRKKDYKKKFNINNINQVYIRKKAKDSNHIMGTAVHRKCPTEENLNFICQNITKKNNDNINNPPKIKEIVIMRNIKKDKNNYLNYSNAYFNNYIGSYNKSFYNQMNYNNIIYIIKKIFDKWKEYSDKKKILYNLKENKQKNKKNRLTSYERKSENNYYINFNKNFIKKFII